MKVDWGLCPLPPRGGKKQQRVTLHATALINPAGP
jgi:hypothetical protein